MYKLIISIIILIMAVTFYWVCSVKILNWGPEYNWTFYAFVIYIMNLIVWIIMISLVDNTIFNTDKKMVLALLFSIPIYTFILIPFNLYSLQQVGKNNDEKFFQKLQAIFEVILHLVTFSLILATLTALVSESF